MSAIAADPDRIKTQQTTVFAVLFAIGFCHMSNDMMQSLLPAIYPTLKSAYSLNFAQIGMVTLVYQLTASLLQPVVGMVSDRRPMPFTLPVGMVFTLVGLLLLSSARSYLMVLTAAALVGVGSSTFHPESSRVARMASGGRHGLAQSLFQVGGNIGSALGPLLAAFIVLRWGQSSIAFGALIALVGIVVLWYVAVWYKTHGLARIQAAPRAAAARSDLSPRRTAVSIAILLALIFSKYLYLGSISSYYTFYLISRFHVSVASSQLHLFVLFGAIAAGTLIGGPIGDRFGRKYVIWCSILGVLPFTLILPYANLFWTGILSVIIGVVIASAFSAILVYAQELVPGRIGMISGLFFGFAFGMGGIGAAVLGKIADMTSIVYVYHLCAYLPALGLLTGLLPNIEPQTKRKPA